MPAIPFRAEVHGAPELATIELHGDVNAAAEARLAAAYREVAEIGAGAVLTAKLSVVGMNQKLP